MESTLISENDKIESVIDDTIIFVIDESAEDTPSVESASTVTDQKQAPSGKSKKYKKYYKKNQKNKQNADVPKESVSPQLKPKRKHDKPLPKTVQQKVKPSVPVKEKASVVPKPKIVKKEPVKLTSDELNQKFMKVTQNAKNTLTSGKRPTIQMNKPMLKKDAIQPLLDMKNELGDIKWGDLVIEE